MDIENAADQIGAELFGTSEPTVETEPQATSPEPAIADSAAAVVPAAGDDVPAIGGAPAPAASTPTAATGEPPAQAARPVPATWRDEVKPLWESLPPKVQDEVLKREEDIFRGLEQYKGDATIGKAMKQAISPHLQMLQQHQVDPAQHVASLLDINSRLVRGSQSERQAILEQMARQFGVTLEASEAPYVDPTIQALQDEVRQLRQGVSVREQESQTARAETLVVEIEQFAKDPARPYFNELILDMTELMNTGGAKRDLSDAYEKAVWRNPATRAKELQRLQTEAVKASEAEKAKHAAIAAKAAGVNVKTSTKAASDTVPLGSMEETMMETLAAMRARK